MWTWIKKLFGKRSEAGPAPASASLPSVSTTSSQPAATTKTSYDERRCFTPNKQPGRITPQAIVLHHSAGSYLGGVEWIANPASKVSYHVLIARDGRRTVFGEDTDRCWHAGVSSWCGRGDLNSWSLGVSWEGDTYDRPLEDAAMESAIEYIAPRMKKWGIPMTRVLTHREVSPGRKNDISPESATIFKTKLKAALN